MKKSLSISTQLIFVALLSVALTISFYHIETINSLIFGNENAGKSKKARKGKRRGKPLPVIVSSIKYEKNDHIIEAIGDGRAKRSVTLYPQASGEVIATILKAGQFVKKGDQLLKLEATKEELAIKIAKTKLADADRNMRRSRELHKRNIGTRTSLDNTQTQYDLAKLELLKAEEALKDRNIEAPFDGYTGIPKVELGDLVNTTNAVVTLDDRSDLIVEFEIPEQFYSKLKRDQKIEVTTPSFEGRMFDGYIEQIDSRIDTSSRTAKIRAVIPNKDDLLRSGMSFAVKIEIEGSEYPSIPELALQWEKGTSFVWRVNNNKAEKVPVKMVRRLNSRILINADLTNNDLVVVEGVQRLRPGKKVKYNPPEESRAKKVSSAR